MADQMYVFAGTGEQLDEFCKRHRIPKRHFRYIVSADDLRGVSEIRYLRLGTWWARAECAAIESALVECKAQAVGRMELAVWLSKLPEEERPEIMFEPDLVKFEESERRRRQSDEVRIGELLVAKLEPGSYYWIVYDANRYPRSLIWELGNELYRQNIKATFIPTNFEDGNAGIKFLDPEKKGEVQ